MPLSETVTETSCMIQTSLLRNTGTGLSPQRGLPVYLCVLLRERRCARRLARVCHLRAGDKRATATKRCEGLVWVALWLIFASSRADTLRKDVQILFVWFRSWSSVSQFVCCRFMNVFLRWYFQKTSTESGSIFHKFAEKSWPVRGVCWYVILQHQMESRPHVQRCTEKVRAKKADQDERSLTSAIRGSLLARATSIAWDNCIACKVPVCDCMYQYGSMCTWIWKKHFLETGQYSSYCVKEAFTCKSQAGSSW